MTADKQMGGFFWRLGVKSTVKEDLAGAKEEVNSFDGSVTGTSDSLMVMDAITKQNTRDIRQMSSGIAIAGGLLLGLSASANQAGIGLGGITSVAAGAGMSLMMIGTTVSSITPIMKAYATFQGSELVNGIKAAVAAQTVQTAVTINAASANAALAASGYAVSPSIVAMAEAETVATAATVGLSGALTLLTVATGVGLFLGAIVIAYQMFTYSEKVAKQATEEQTKALKDQKIAIDDIKSSLTTYNSLIDEYNNKELTASELKNAHTSAVLTLQSAIKKAAQSGTPENLLAVSEARNQVIRTQNAMDKGAARVAELPGLINEQATKATAAERQVQYDTALTKDLSAIDKKWADYEKEMNQYGLSGYNIGSMFARAKETEIALGPRPGINVAQVPMVGSGIAGAPQPLSINIQNLNVSGIGETAIGDTGLMLKIERKRAV
jgi:hypothetical protein